MAGVRIHDRGGLVSRVPLLVTAIAVSLGLLLGGAAGRSLATPSWQWYKADFHVHSVVSADAFPDLGVISASAKANGFNAIFLTDHNLGSNFPISGMTANHMFFEDSYRRWTTATTGALSASTNQLVMSPVASGTSSLHLAGTSNTAGESFVWTKRGPTSVQAPRTRSCGSRCIRRSSTRDRGSTSPPRSAGIPP
jgi:hypothetical protein